MSAAAARVLCVRLSALGDVVETVGAVRALARAAAGVELWWLVQEDAAPVLQGLDFDCELIRHDRTGGVRAVWRTARALRARRFDVALDLQGNWKSALLCRLSGAGRCLGVARGARREPASALLLSKRVPCPADAHPAAAALAVVRAFCPGALPAAPALIATEAEVRREAVAVAAVGVDPQRPFTVVVGTDGRDPRDWPSRWWPAATAGGPAVVLLGPAEAAAPPDCGLAVLRHGRGELRRLVGLGALVARAGGRVLGPDRGATHVLAACGAECHALFGAQDPRRTGPVGSTAWRRADAPECLPCRARQCAHDDGPVCMHFAPPGAHRLGTIGVEGGISPPDAIV